MEQRSGVPVGQDHSVWDYVLPKMDFPGTPLYKDGPKPFDLESLIYNIQLGADCRYVRNYLANYDKAHVRRELNGIIDGFPSIFYVVARNDDSILRLWVANGGNVGAIHEASQVPLLAFAIAHSENSQRDMTAIVATILGLGADPACIPEEFYTPYTDDLPIDGPETIEENEKTAWCKIEARKKLGKTLNFSQRYFLWRATCTDRPSVRAKQITLRKNAQAILEIPYFMIGQTVASNRIFTRLLNHISMPSSKTKPNMKPLVLVFAGPSGHGKTELARQLGHLLSLDLEVADCTIVEHERELFGPRHPYVGAERGTPLNNFLARHADQGCIAFLDEFEKTTKDVHEALLLPFDNGEYQDRRDLRRINCTKTIWILATNALDEQIISFCDRYEDIIVGDESTKQKLGRTLSKELKQAFLQRFGAPLTGRISDFVPFVPFSAGEQAVVAHKFLRELTSTIREPVDLCEGSGERLIGNINLHVKHDASVCTTIAKSDYSRDLGARSLSVAVKAVEGLVVELYYQEDEEIVEDGKMMDVMVDSHAGEIRVKLLDPSS
ncbi:P-loop containing nucleoside triphosphate hydrolase protein [Pleomassaria siparia CBS 279.74]|uniref:P-loop containing nucleoside triphosphate hydrolase protein n=1 Tax=Pleomassaria siparia CBS 279.74 TaxID=1314801 RepID=A0A6G1KB55_9PLEO|nr:P-loop containing nucleoside triphosphate hydrolase protein [Pleomassaria siparia CBS 279.74]